MAKYRADIDGLRALAVLPVVAFHAEVPGFGGGFVGVDVFFVISGYLITGILKADLDRGRYSILSFYDRRVRRIFPALFAVFAAVVLASGLLYAPIALRAMGRSLVASVLFSSNVLFYLESGYFDAASIEKPLLHTWSLSVEEQFYIAWPLLLAAAHRFARARLFALTVAAAVASFALSVWGTAVDPSAAFYLPVTRAWELLLGALLALGRPDGIGPRWGREALSLLGFVLVAISVAAYDEATPFPGIAAVLPCAGTALMIATNGRRDTTVARALSIKPLVFVGLVSYSLYLWHWPVLAFARYWWFDPLPWPIGLALMAPAFACALASWRFIERPFRRPPNDRSAPVRSIRASLFAMWAFAAIGGAFYLGGGWPWRLDDRVVAAEAASRDVAAGQGACSGTAPTPKPPCRLGDRAAAARVVLWGDSHAGALAPAVDAAAAAAGAGGRLISLPACPPLMDVDVIRVGAGAGPSCPAFNAAALARIAQDRAIETVVLAARWPLHAEATRFGTERGGERILVDSTLPDGTAYGADALRSGLRRTVAALTEARPDVRIVLVGPIPEVGFHVPECLARARRFGRDEARCHTIDREKVRTRQATARAVFGAAGEGLGGRVVWFDPVEQLCDGERCWAVRGERVLYVDDDHLSRVGARELAAGLPLFAP